MHNAMVGEGEQSKEDLEALVALIKEEASKDNSPLGRSDSLALRNIRKLLGIPQYGKEL